MDPIKEKRLKALKRKQQLRLQVDQVIEQSVKEWLEIYDYLRLHSVPNQLLRLAWATSEEAPFWEQRLATPPLQAYGFGPELLWVDKKPLEEERIFEAFPNTHPLRYVPNLPPLDIQQVASDPKKYMSAGTEKLGLSANEWVYLCYLNYCPLLRMPIGAIAQHANELFGGWYGDILIFPSDCQWLIFQSLEEEWYVGRWEP